MSNLASSGVIDGQLGLYEEQAEAWKPNHDRATDCFELEAVLGLGLSIYRSIRAADERWTEDVRSGAIPLRKDAAERLAGWYSWWTKPCDVLLGKIRDLQRDGYAVKHSAEFRQACLDVRSALSISLDQALLPSGTAPGRRTGEVRDALRRHLGPRGYRPSSASANC